MRLIGAFATSVAVHAGMFLIPSGELAFDGVDSAIQAIRPLQVSLTERRPMVAVNEAYKPTLEEPSQSTDEERLADSGTGQGLGMPAPYYYSAKEVGERAKPIQQIDLDSQPLVSLPEGGKLILVLFINESGGVDKVEAESSNLAGAMEAVIADQFRNARFSPAIREGKAVKSRMKIEVVVRPPVAMVVPPPPQLLTPGAVGEN